MISLGLLFRPIRFAAKRLKQGRRGSVLLLVVVLLVLLALVGATYLSTSRQSRVMSAQNVQNSDVDAMLDGICQACQGVIVDDLNDNAGNLNGNITSSNAANQGVHGVYRGPYESNLNYSVGDIVSYAAPSSPPATTTSPNFFVAVVAVPSTSSIAPALGITTPWLQTSHVPGVTSSLIQPWLADRIPTPEGVTGTPLTLAYWPNISQMAVPAGGTSPTSILGTPFESPDGTPIPQLSAGLTLVGRPDSSATPTLVPDFELLKSGVYVPALKCSGAELVAGDADGDGIADSLFFRIPGTNIDGLTWYAAVRIIDNNSAINLNTALSRDDRYTLSSGSLVSAGLNSNYYSLFQTSVGLSELLNPKDNFAGFLGYRIGTGATANPDADASPGAMNPLLPASRPDFEFLDGDDSLYQQLIRRIANPGFNGNGIATTRFQTLSLSDQAALAYRFCLVNPQTVMSQNPASITELLLPLSLNYSDSSNPAASYYRSTPYGNSGAPAASDVNQWFSDNFDYGTTPADYGSQSQQPLRALLVTRNPVSNAIAPVYDSNASNVGEPLEPLGLPSNPYNPPTNVISGMMLPYGMAPDNYVHFKGLYNSATTYNFNDIVIGGDGHTYIYVYNPKSGAPAPASNQLVSPTLKNILPNKSTAPYTNGLALYDFWQYQPWTTAPVKANVNTATFRELYRAFWSVMAGNPSSQPPFGTAFNTNTNSDPNTQFDPYWPDPSSNALASNPQHQFRSPLRDPTYTASTAIANITRLDPENTMLLRAAIAAVNTLGLRDASQNVISRTVFLKAVIPNLPKGQQPFVMARVYSNAPQPVISEVYASAYAGPDSGATNEQGYVAVELYNPYSVPMLLKNWQLGLVNRSPGGSNYPTLKFTESPGPNGTPVPVIAPQNMPMQAQNNPLDDQANDPSESVPAGTIILGPHGYALLENYNPAANGPASGGAAGRPINTGMPQTGIWSGPDPTHPNTCDVYAPGLQLVIQNAAGGTESTPPKSTGGELVLLRPRLADGDLSSSDDPLNTFDEGTTSYPNLYDMVPVDSYDFTGLSLGTSTSGNVWSYRRIKGAAPDTWFKQFYPGRYFAMPAPAPREGPTANCVGTDVQTVSAPAITGNPASVTPWSQNGIAAPAFGQDVEPINCSYTNPFRPIQIYNTYQIGSPTSQVQGHWPNPTAYPGIPAPTDSIVVQLTSASPQAPYGTFARNGDLLDIPFIGAYRITLASIGNPKAGDTSWCFLELNSLPRDCSFADATYSDAAHQSVENVGRFCPLFAGPIPVTPDYYSWAANLFSYLTVQSSSDAALPNFDPDINDVTSWHELGNPQNTFQPAYKYPPAGLASSPAPTPAIVLAADPTASNQTDQGTVGVEGLININTASWKVLSMLPMVTINEDKINYATDNKTLAKAIVSWRITNGPFTSIFDLNKVAGFQSAQGNITPANGGKSGGVSTLNGLLTPPDLQFPGATPLSSANPTGVSSSLDEDYQSDFAMLSRISNLITTRSDTFTVYVEVQGWANAGTLAAQPMITRRYAYIADRSEINGDPRSRFVRTVTVPTE